QRNRRRRSPSPKRSKPRQKTPWSAAYLHIEVSESSFRANAVRSASIASARVMCLVIAASLHPHDGPAVNAARYGGSHGGVTIVTGRCPCGGVDSFHAQTGRAGDRAFLPWNAHRPLLRTGQRGAPHRPH